MGKEIIHAGDFEARVEGSLWGEELGGCSTMKFGPHERVALFLVG